MSANQDRVNRVAAASAGAGSARDRERNILKSNAQKIVDGQLSGTSRVSQAEFDRARAISGGFLDPTSGKPTGRTLPKLGSTRNPIRSLQPNKSLVSSFITSPNKSQDLRINQGIFERTLTPNIAKPVASIRRPDGSIVGIDEENLSIEEIEALQIISGQQAATSSLADQISARRRAALLLGGTAAEANQFATSGESAFKGFEVAPVNPAFINEKGEFGFGKSTQNRINTELQQKQVRRNAAKLDAAQVAIKNQTTSGKAGDLNNLQAILDATPDQDKPVSRIIASTDETGNLVSRRNVALQTENALLTGIDPENFNLDVQTSGGREATRLGTNAPNVGEINEVIRNSAQKILQGTEFPDTFVSTQQGPDGELFIDFAPGLPETLQQASAQQISSDLGSFFGGVGNENQRRIEESILNGEILNLGDIIPNFPELEDFGTSLSGGGGGFGFGDISNPSGLPLVVVIILTAAAIGGLVLFGRRNQ